MTFKVDRCKLQVSSYSESTSTLQFGSRVSEITLGAAKKNVESGLMLDAREASAKLQRETNAARAEAAAAHEALEFERAEVDQLRSANEMMQKEISRLKVDDMPVAYPKELEKPVQTSTQICSTFETSIHF